MPSLAERAEESGKEEKSGEKTRNRTMLGRERARESAEKGVMITEERCIGRSRRCRGRRAARGNIKRRTKATSKREGAQKKASRKENIEWRREGEDGMRGRRWAFRGPAMITGFAQTHNTRVSFACSFLTLLPSLSLLLAAASPEGHSLRALGARLLFLRAPPLSAEKLRDSRKRERANYRGRGEWRSLSVSFYKTSPGIMEREYDKEQGFF